MFYRFFRCERGNFAFITAAAALPALTLIAGGLEFAEYNKTKASMQHAADTAVMAAMTSPDPRWSKRVRRAHRFFDVNFQQGHRTNGIKKQLSGKRDRERLVMTYQATTSAKRLFGELNPFTKDKIKVTARAEYILFSSRPPRLISPGSNRIRSR
ncbi:MAG: pilus assembly protein TadG-related protein [Rhizobiaceae bacterium]